MKQIKNILPLIFLICYIQSNSQTKTDTIVFNYKESSYITRATESVEKLIDINVRLKKEININEEYSENLFIDSISNLKIVSIPIFTFKKEVLDYKKGENLISYINFGNDILSQEVLVFEDNQQIYINNIYDINNIDYKKIETSGYHPNISLLENINYTRWYLDCLDLTIDNNNLIFKILDNYCIVINGRVYVIYNKSADITLTEFNMYFINDIDLIQQQTKEKKLVYKARVENNPLPKDKIFLLVKKE